MRTPALALLSGLIALGAAVARPAAAQDAAPAAAPASSDIPPYAVSDANAGTTPIAGDKVFRAFHGKAGIDRVVTTLVGFYHTDPKLKDIFAAADFDRLQRMLSEQICYITGGPCHYTGRDMASSHHDIGLQTADFDALVEDLQKSMDAEHVPFWAQNRLLAKLAPMKRVVVTR